MKIDIVTRSFVYPDGKAIELEEHRAQHPDSKERHWSSCCFFVPSPDPDRSADRVRTEIKQPLIEVVPTRYPESGIWVRGSHYLLVSAVGALDLGWSKARS